MQPGRLFTTIYRGVSHPNHSTRHSAALFNSAHAEEEKGLPATMRHGDNQAAGSSITVEVHYTLLLVIMVSSVAINGLVFLLFYHRPSLRLTSNKFVLNMAIVHLLQTFLVMPFVFVSVMFQGWIFREVMCQIHGATTLCLTMANVLSILLIAVDRNCAVNSPLHYSMTITKKRTSGLIVSAWVFSVSVSLPPLAKVSRYEYQDRWALCTVVWYEADLLTIAYSCLLFVVGFLLPFVRITWIYTSMFRAARKNSARARLHNFNTPELSPPPDGQQPCAMYIHRRTAWTKRTSSLSQASSLFGDEWKAVRTGLLVVMSFTACFLPFFSVILLEPHTRSYDIVFRNLPAISMLLIFSSSLIGPYLYVIRNKATRKHVRKIFTCLRRKPSIFSSKGYHYSRPAPDSHFSGDNAADVGSSVSIHSATSGDYQKTLVAHSLYQNKSGNWKIVTVAAPPSRRSSLGSNIILRPRGEDLQQYYQQRCASSLRATAIRNGYNRRASLDNSKVLSARHDRADRDFDLASIPSPNSQECRSMSFRLRGRFANRDESIETCYSSCDSSYGQEDWSRFVEQPTRRGRTDSHCSVSTLLCNEQQLSSIAQVHQYRVCGTSTASYGSRPVLKRGRSFAFDEGDTSYLPSPKISQYGGVRKSHFVNAKSYPRHSSSETTTTTLGSSTSTDSQDIPSVSSPPPVFQYQHCAHMQQRALQEERRDSGFEDAMLGKCDICYTIVDETGSIKAVKFVEQ
ncbi:uncharacterized protein LOC135369792 [Ornithodoros turicata]|uniref:uncharacterized protein LOC135369792 n=1 Tax=Ornithodoros turicata TaxID=34597 RepID=UPI003139F641